MRVLWGDIQSVNFKNRYNIPFMEIMNKRGEVLGEIRLDCDNLKDFYEILDTYCPENNPIRILFNNQRKS